MSRRHVTVLLASYRGAAHIGTQLASLAAQDYRDWSLVVSDDGSDDATREIVSEFAASQPKGRVNLVSGPGQGATANFLSLLAHVPDHDLAAFCDQDDLWFPDKLSRAVEAMEGLRRPAHYAARTIIADAALRPICGSRFFHRPLGLRNALVQACMAGNTSVYNAQAVAILKQGAIMAAKEGVISHDWWAYQLMAGMGADLIHDRRPALLYRQHENSSVGRNDTAPALLARLQQIAQGKFGRWMAANLRALTPFLPEMRAENRRTVSLCQEMLEMPGPSAARRMRHLRLYRQTVAGTTALLLSAATGRLAVRPVELRSPETA
ncbi:MAG: glycosyltransferase [Paracoccus sp. (in: a-proteobacteria)]|nr:glycosyltransferase [Paracoccus sp. (in: a-proteobacteria)]